MNYKEVPFELEYPRRAEYQRKTVLVCRRRLWFVHSDVRQIQREKIIQRGLADGKGISEGQRSVMQPQFMEDAERERDIV